MADDKTTTLVHLDDPNAPEEIEGYNVADLVLATKGFVMVFRAIAANGGSDLAMSALMSAVISIGPRVVAEADLVQLLHEAAGKAPAVYAWNAERNSQAAAELETRKDLN